MEDYPLISVITAVRNGAPYLRPLIDSVLAQDYPNVEHIIIDDGSTDDGATVAVLQSYPHLRWWSRENKGQYATQNEGLEAATGSIVVVIAADDAFIVPDSFSRVISYFKAHSDCDMVYGKTMRVNADGKPVPNHSDPTGAYPRSLLRYYLFISHNSLFVKRDFIVKHGIYFDAALKYRGDYDWINHLAAFSHKMGYIPHNLSIYRLHNAQTTRHAARKLMIAETRLVCERYGGNYRWRVFVQWLLSLRAWFIIATTTIKKQGLGSFGSLLRDWVRRHVARSV